MKKNFISFLKRNGAYASYRKFIIPSARNEIIRGNISYNIINHSFSWEDTKEGYDFWSIMANDWTNHWFYYYRIN
jgi:hypothetical protein